jgi:pre-mRNA-splicing helicase BRR2
VGRVEVPLDVLQMLGRAGRPASADSGGERVSMTQHSELQYYLSLTNLQLPIESPAHQDPSDHLNADLFGHCADNRRAVDWLSYTFLYIE